MIEAVKNASPSDCRFSCIFEATAGNELIAKRISAITNRASSITASQVGLGSTGQLKQVQVDLKDNIPN